VHIDTFVRDNRPPANQWPELVLDRPELVFPEQLNCTSELLDRHVTERRGDRLRIRALGGMVWTCVDLAEKANRIAQVPVDDMGLVPSNRVLLRAPDNPMLAACWFAVMKAGTIAMATMPLLRAEELPQIVDKAKTTHALYDATLAEKLVSPVNACPGLRQIYYFNDGRPNDLETHMARHASHFDTVPTAADDVCLIAFTLGTTGVPKATMNFDRGVMAMCACWQRYILRPEPDDVFIGTRPLAFTFGLGGLLLFPIAAGAPTVLLDKAELPQLLEGIKEFGATALFTALTSFCTLLPAVPSCAPRRFASASRQVRYCPRRAVRCGRRRPAFPFPGIRPVSSTTTTSTTRHVRPT
jgi:2-aminobenzoate-CoA ligase